MTVAQLDSLVTLLRSRPAPPRRRTSARSRARFEKMARLPGRRAGRQVREGRCRRRAGRMGGGAGLRRRAGGALPAWRRLRHRLDQHPSPARLRHLRRLGRARPGDRLSAGAGASLPGRGRRRGRRRGAGCCSRASPRTGWRSPAIRPAAASPSPRWSICATRSSACRPAPWRSRRGSISRASGNSITARSAQDPMVQKDGLLLDGRDVSRRQGCEDAARGAAACRPQGPAAGPGPGRHGRDAARRRHAHRRAAACRRRRGAALASGPTCCTSSRCSRRSSRKGATAASRSATSSAAGWPEMKFGVTVVPSVSDWKLFVDLETMGYDCAWAANSQMLYSDAYAVLALAAAEHLAHPARHRRRRGAGAARAGHGAFDRHHQPARARPRLPRHRHRPHRDARDGPGSDEGRRLPRVSARAARAAARRGGRVRR